MLSKTAEYALRAVAALAGQPDGPASADLLAEKTKVPRRYLHRVLQDLAAAGLVASRPGPGGGYSLAREPGRVSILDVVNAVSPIERIRACPLGLTSHTELCPLHAELDKAYAATEAAFAGVTVRELLDSASPVVPLCEGPAPSAPPSKTAPLPA
ncbi:Rrf2 family transcriptional regulator [Alienimonas californiensis]|uniref:Transcriptional repressor NsrR n=1 Tax=Alienimonas californiensis TaxID=2527989 RepID=A0A517PDB6_9PLAN|nr:Rrf2 family transcriptional regulator [Alienimonas californiensis]QDT17375.1 transcriptional repressor NsrR [Alienimonas californiensis]